VATYCASQANTRSASPRKGQPRAYGVFGFHPSGVSVILSLLGSPPKTSKPGIARSGVLCSCHRLRPVLVGLPGVTAPRLGDIPTCSATLHLLRAAAILQPLFVIEPLVRLCIVKTQATYRLWSGGHRNTYRKEPASLQHSPECEVVARQRSHQAPWSSPSRRWDRTQPKHRRWPGPRS
jgi:hypothetical protein